MDKKNASTFWQWNCRGYQRKRALLQQYLELQQEAPVAIVLQETGKAPVRLSGYQNFDSGKGDKSRVTTFVKRNIATIVHDVSPSEAEAVLVEIITGKKNSDSIFLLNVYSTPRQKKIKFITLFRKALKAAAGRPLIIMGDFNAAHEEWGYTYRDPKGRRIWEDLQTLGLTLHTDPCVPTRTGNSITRDTAPDLTITHMAGTVTWKSTGQNLGSDHFIISLTLGKGVKTRLIKQPKLTEWDKFREIRKEASLPDDIYNIDEWTHLLKTHIGQATTTIEDEDAPPALDSKLLNMWSRKSNLEKRLKAQRWNRNIRRELARLNKEIETYAIKLNEQNWHSKCDEMQANMSLSKTWSLLRHLIDPSKSKMQASTNQVKARHGFVGTDDELISELQETYLGKTESEVFKDYEGPPNPDLDAPITSTEVRAEINNLRKRSAPGPDGITNTALRNLDDESIIALTKYMNQVWETGELPKTWKQADVVFIPKPGKVPSLSNMRPISLTSCVGKLMEHVVQTRLTRYMEENDLWPHEMVGFRPGLSTQDVMLRLKHDILDRYDSTDTRAILGLDLTKAFDNVSHEAILAGLEEVGVGHRAYTYVKDFLSQREANIKFLDVKSPPITLGSKGTPQGSVLSPFLFNIVMRSLPAELNKIKSIKFSMYADDINIWVNSGSDAAIELKLQIAANMVEEYAARRGLSCSPQKSELLIIEPKHQRRHAGGSMPINVFINGKEVPKVEEIRILGMYIQRNGYNLTTIKKLEGYAAQVTGIFRRVALKGRGLKENSLLRLMQAFITSRIAYATPYLVFKQEEKEKIDAIIRKSVKRALGLPDSTSTDLLLKMGVHNTLVELIEAVRISQLERLGQSKTGRKIMEWVGIQCDRGAPTGKKDIPLDVRKRFRIAPLPKNMHPIYNKERRAHRAKALVNNLKNTPAHKVAYVDAACGRDGAAVSTVVDGDGCVQIACSTCTRDACTAEEVAVALACAGTKAGVILCDSKLAIRNFSNGRISEEALKILLKNPPSRDITFVWVPAHEEVAGNEAAHELARALYHRATLEQPVPGIKDSIITYREIVDHYKAERKIFPPPHRSLSLEDARIWRRLQGNNYTSPYWIYLTQTRDYNDALCKICKEKGTLDHVIWECAGSPGAKENIDSREAWEALLQSEAEDDQSRAIRLAVEAVKTHRPQRAGTASSSPPTYV